MSQIKLIIFVLTLCTHANAATLSCNWLKSEDHAPGFYRPSKLVMDLSDDQVLIKEDTFLFRQYSPCWVGNFSSCAFGFTYYGKVWKVENKVNNTITMTAPGAYWRAELKVEFEKDILTMKRSEVTPTLLSGNDGDGVWFENEAFLCQKI